MKIVCFLLAVLCFFILIGGSVLLGCVDMLKPFDAIPLGAMLLVVGFFGTFGFTGGVIAICAGERW